MIGSTGRLDRAVLAAVLLATLGLVSGVQAQPPDAPPPASAASTGRTFGGEQRVTAAEVLVDIYKKRTLDAGDLARRSLHPKDFTLVVDGEPRPVTAVETFDHAEAEPWRLVIYLDAGLSSSRQLAWGARELAGVAAELTARGEVEVVVADPEPRLVLPATRDAELVGSTLFGLAEEAEGLDWLIRHRQEVLEALPGLGDDEPAELVAQAIDSEAKIVEQQQDRMLARLAETTGRRRALLAVSGGWDVASSGFYGALAAAPDRSPAAVAGEGLLLALAETGAATLAGYGWVTIDLLRPYVPSEDYSPPGIRIGKWRFHYGGTREAERDPEKAEALIELAEVKRAAGRHEEAADAYRQAIHHFYKDPRTIEREAVAYRGLAEALDELGDEAAARWARRQAADLDPALGGEAVADARLLDPAAPLELRARSSAGAVVRSSEELAGALAGLDRRLALGFELDGPPRGELLPLETTIERPLLELRAPLWARWSVPPTISAARARRLAEGDDLVGGEPVETALALDGPSAALALDLSSWNDGEVRPRPLRLRVSLATSGPRVATRVRHELVEIEAGVELRLTLPVELPPGSDRLAVVVEDLDDGRWGGRRLTYL